MTLYEIFKAIPMLQIKDASLALLGVVVIATGLIEFVPVKINPWTALLVWAGNRINKKINDRMEQLEKKQAEFEEKFDSYVTDQKKKDLDDTRSQILSFCNECMRHKQHTREQFRFIIRRCDEYEKYIEDNKLKNGEISDAIEQIRNIHRKCLAENSFLVPEDEGKTDDQRPALIMSEEVQQA